MKKNLPKYFKTAILPALLLLLAIKIFLIGYYTIPQNGMYPGLAAGSIIFTLRHGFGTVKRGDIVVFKHEENGIDYDYVWRVVGVAGDRVETSGNSLAVNGKPVTRRKIREENDVAIFREENGGASYEIALEQKPSMQPPDEYVTVPSGQCFVMGDNRYNAKDSRFFGPIELSSIIGKKL